MYNREEQEKYEINFLNKYSARSKYAIRKIEEEPDELRTSYQRDRDRITHSKSFRRLKHKTQVYISPEKDHYRTRLTHTFEVSQIARTISRALKLNEDLTEAIALAHDIGHTPFGHMGEEALNYLNPKGFKHYLHSVRVVELLESTSFSRGLNLTIDVLDGIGNHTGMHIAKTLEGNVIKFADRIAYINHDIDDSIRAGILKNNDIPKIFLEEFGFTSSERINTMVKDLVYNSYNKSSISMSENKFNSMLDFRKFMFENVYFNPIIKKDEIKAKGIIENLFNYYKKDLNRLPHNHVNIYKNNYLLADSTDEDIITDYIAGMTDTFAIQQYMDLFIPKQWRI